MAARRCTFCDVNYPAVAQFQTCPIHNEETDLLQNANHSPDWKEKLAALQVAKADSERPIRLVRGVAAYEDGGILWVNQEELYRAGARINSRGPSFALFELEDGCVYETQGWHESGRRWWVEQMTCNEEEPSQRTTSADVPSSTESATN